MILLSASRRSNSHSTLHNAEI